MQATCGKVGGTWKTSFGNPYCAIDYRSPADGATYHYTVSFDSEGNIIATAANNADECRGLYGPNVTGVWHSDTLICAI